MKPLRGNSGAFPLGLRSSLGYVTGRFERYAPIGIQIFPLWGFHSCADETVMCFCCTGRAWRISWQGGVAVYEVEDEAAIRSILNSVKCIEQVLLPRTADQGRVFLRRYTEKVPPRILGVPDRIDVAGKGVR